MVAVRENGEGLVLLIASTTVSVFSSILFELGLVELNWNDLSFSPAVGLIRLG